MLLRLILWVASFYLEAASFYREAEWECIDNIICTGLC